MINEQIAQDIIVAMKAHEQEKLDALRMLSAAIKNEQIALGHEPTDDEILKVINRQIKQRREASTQYRDAGRTESADKEDREAHIFEGYLPAQMGDEELTSIVREAISEVGATSAADMGRVIGAVKAKVGNAADGARISTIVKTALSA